MNNFKKQQIASTVIKVLLKRFETFPVDASNNRNAPFHEAFLNAFRDNFDDRVSDIPFFISLSSWLHGLNTTLGQTFFEKVAHILSDGEKREYTSKKLGNLQIPRAQKDKINELMTALSNSERVPNLHNENAEIFSLNSHDLVNAIDFSADVFIEDENSVTAIELKSVKPNSGEMKGEKQKILEGKAALNRMFADKDVSFFIGFPFDPTSSEPTGYDKDRFLGSIINMTKFFDPEETLIASELWDKLSGERGTMQEILGIINAISTPEFMENYQYLNNSNNRSEERYKELLRAWSLFSEIEILQNEEAIKEFVRGNSRLLRIFNQGIFKDDEYNWQRSEELLNIQRT